MHAMLLARPAMAPTRPLSLESVPDPEPRPDEVIVSVSACGVCRTDLHVVEGELAAVRLPIIPGHQAVGRIVALGSAVTRFRPGDRVGVAWVNRLCGCCDPCIEGRENLCEAPVFTGLHRDGGFAEKVAVPASYAHPIPAEMGDDAQVAPLLCAGIIGYRALKRSGLEPGMRIALYGFGAAAHIAIQIARAWGCEVFVVTRGKEAEERARRMGAAWSGGPGETPPRPVDCAVTFAPAGSVIPGALRSLRRGGRLAIAGIYLDRIPELDYDAHLFQERELVSVTANTRRDARELLDLAARIGIRTDIEVFPLEEANEALIRLKEDRLSAQAAVLRVG
ncbi:MAG: zinc-dependent alcohol dehydrogenase family protein [Candidatus Eisenbacteria bacterium]|nr:zinc-dependent alcohol dehydrogenase family protein [Candidatus Eisenbacteria bacterium]